MGVVAARSDLEAEAAKLRADVDEKVAAVTDTVSTETLSMRGELIEVITALCPHIMALHPCCYRGDKYGS